MVLDTGAASRGSGNANSNKEKEVRKWFVEQDVIEGVIYLPENLFYNTTAPGIIIVLDKAKPKERRGKLFLLNAAGEFTKGDPKNFLAEDAIQRIGDRFTAWKEVEKYSRVVTLEEIARNDYNVSPSRYIHAGEAGEYRPIAEIVEELEVLEVEAAMTDVALKKFSRCCMSEIQAMNSTELGDLPSAWRVQRFDSLFAVQQGKQVSKQNRVGENQRPFLRTKNVFWGGLDLSDLDEMHFSETDENRLALKPGDILVCEGGDIGRSAIWRGTLARCYYQNHLHRARLRGEAADSEFVLYWLWYAFEVGSVYFGRGNVTTIPNLSQSKLCELPLPVPPVYEQRKIAAVLGAVQRAIEQQERLLQLTAELKKTLLHQLFTQGLRGEPQKQTEIGSVPESWEVAKIGDVAKLQSGGTPARDASEYWQGGTIPWVKTGEIDYCVIWGTEERITPAGMVNSAAKLFPEGTLLMPMYGQGVTRGRVAILGIEAATNQACAAITPRDEARVSSRFLYYFLEYQYENLRKLGHGANQRNMNAALIRGFPVAFPTPVDQNRIISALSALDLKSAIHQRKHSAFSDLFRTLLHQLMTAQIRVHDLELPALD